MPTVLTSLITKVSFPSWSYLPTFYSVSWIHFQKKKTNPDLGSVFVKPKVICPFLLQPRQKIKGTASATFFKAPSSSSMENFLSSHTPLSPALHLCWMDVETETQKGDHARSEPGTVCQPHCTTLAPPPTTWKEKLFLGILFLFYYYLGFLGPEYIFTSLDKHLSTRIF